MVRKIITPTDTVVTVDLPQEMVGKTVEVLAFEVEEDVTTSSSKEERLRRIEELTSKSLVDLSNFKFNRDEANNYDE